MRELRRLGAGRFPSRFKDQNVFVGVREMVLAADDMADAEVDVVGTRCQVIRRHAVAPQEREVFDVVGGFDLLAVYGVGETDFFSPAAGDAEAESEGLSGRSAAVALGAGKVAHARIEEPSLIGTGLFCLAGVGRGEVAVGEPLLKDGIGDLAVEREALGLRVLLIPPKIKPAQTFKNE